MVFIGFFFLLKEGEMFTYIEVVKTAGQTSMENYMDEVPEYVG